MKNKRLKLREHSFHIVGQTLDKNPFPMELQTLWDILALHLNMLTISYRIRVRAMTLMGNHFHLLISSPYEDPKIFCQSLQEGLHRLSGRDFLDEIFSQKVIHPVYYQYVYKYIYRNPVTAGLSHRVQDYPFTTLSNVLGQKAEMFLIFDNMNMIYDPERMIRWLNEPIEYPPELEELNYLFS